MKFFPNVLLLTGALTCSGCAIRPMSGPERASIEFSGENADPNYGMVKLTSEAISIISEYGPAGIAASFPDRRPPPTIKFGIGDVVSVTIFEAAAVGVFIPSEAGVRPW